MNALAKPDSPRVAHRPELRWFLVPVAAAAAVAAVWLTDLPQGQVQAATIASVATDSAWGGDPSVPAASSVRFDVDAAAAHDVAPTF